MSRAPAQPNQSLIDGLQVLQAVAGSSDAVGSRALAQQLELEPTRVNRLLKTLASMDVLRQDSQRKYEPGPGIHVLAAMSLYGSGLLPRALPILRDFDTQGLTLALGVLWRGRVAYLYHQSPRMTPDEALGRVGLFPALRSGIGVAVLASTTRSRAAPVAEARRRGYADVIADEARQLRSIGVALSDASGAGIAVSGKLVDAQVASLAERLTQAASDIVDRQGAT